MKRLIFATTLFLSVGGVNAALLDITDIEGSWANADPVTVTVNNASGQATDTVRWGIPLSNQSDLSGYNFTTSGDLTGILSGSIFSLGTFVHINNPVYPPSLNTIDYLFNFTTNGDPTSLSTVFNFDHDETTNSSPCAAGSFSICDDYVTISTPTIDQLFTVNGEAFYFNLLGFSTDGTTYSTTFQSPEGGYNTANLYAMVTAQPVPAPSILALLGLGLAGLGFTRRRRTLKA